MPPALVATPRKPPSAIAPEKKYKCQFCNRAFSRSEHRSRHERSHTKERPFKCLKCRSTFVRRDLLLRHDRTVHAKDGGVPLHSDVKRRAGPKSAALATAKSALDPAAAFDPAALEQIEAGSDGIVDLETAAMLMTDLHHKATAAMRGSPHHHRPPHLPASVTYPNGAIGLPHVPWDAFMPRPAVIEPTSLSTTSASQHSTPSFTTVSPALHDRVPPRSRRHKATPSCNGLVPALQQMIDSLPPSSVAGTPSQHSPGLARDDDDDDVDDDDMPPAAAANAPQLIHEAERVEILERIRSYDAEGAIPESFRLPPRPALNRFLATYFGLFHHHLPFLHPTSFAPTRVAAPLLLAVLSIGALYAFDQDAAYMLHIGSKVLVNQFLQHKENFSSRKCPLWTMQSSLLNMIFASWSGDPKGLEWACSIKSLLANMVAGNRYELKLRSEARNGALPTRAEWIEDEGCRRTYYAVYIFFGLMTLTYNHTPAISFNEFEDLQLPSTEDMWNGDFADEAHWLEALRASHILSFLVAHDGLFQGETLRYSAFATRVMINALFLEVWYHKRSPEALQDVVTEYKLRLALETWETSLAACEPETVPVPLSAPHAGHPLIFNALALFRNTRARLEVDLKSIQEAMRYHDPYEVAAAMSHARDKVKRSSEMLKVIHECYTCLETAALQGLRWVARTSATNWSPEHPLCGFDLMIILSLWLYRLEHDEEPATADEMLMWHKVRALLDEDVGDDPDAARPSHTVARLWGSMLDEVVVWGYVSFALHCSNRACANII